MAKNQRFLIRWKEQGQHYCVDETVFAQSEKEALEKLRDKLLIKHALGSHYLWIMKVANQTKNESTLYVKRIDDIIGRRA